MPHLRHVQDGDRGTLVAPGGRDAAEVIHGDLRARILSGDVPAGSELSQTGVARDDRVSRGGPVREAFRLLQRDGLISALVNQHRRAIHDEIASSDRRC